MMILYDIKFFNVILGLLYDIEIGCIKCFIRRNTLFLKAKHFVSTNETC